MSVIIDDFEVLPQSNPTPSSTEQSGVSGGHAISEREVQELLRREREREQRVRAH